MDTRMMGRVESGSRCRSLKCLHGEVLKDEREPAKESEGEKEFFGKRGRWSQEGREAGECTMPESWGG